MKRLALAAAVVLLATLVVMLIMRRDGLRLQWACYQVTSAPTYEVFRQQIEQFQQEPPIDRRLRALVARWHTGNATFDDHLSRYVYDAQCSEELREMFSRELSWRENLVTAWADHWRAQKPEAQEQIESLRRYLEALHDAQPPRSITWRDVLDFQAALACTDQGRLAHRLTPENWRGRYQRWEEALAQAGPDR